MDFTKNTNLSIEEISENKTGKNGTHFQRNRIIKSFSIVKLIHQEKVLIKKKVYSI